MRLVQFPTENNNTNRHLTKYTVFGPRNGCRHLLGKFEIGEVRGARSGWKFFTCGAEQRIRTGQHSADGGYAVNFVIPKIGSQDYLSA